MKNTNNNLVSEIKNLQQNLTNIKFENLCLKEKLDKFSNGNSNENDIIDSENININNNFYYDDNKNEFLNGKSTSN